jgi:predicted patatin/cPLA2 family phospholipase
MSSKEAGETTISVVVQGGAMRSIYCLGAVRALVDTGYADRVRSVHTASAGCVSGVVLLARRTDGRTVADMRDLLLDRLSGGRFINLRRVHRIVDVDYLLESMRVVVSLSSEMFLTARQMSPGLVFEVGLTDARTGSPRYIDIAGIRSDLELYQTLRATMAIPYLYRKIIFQGRRYIDGGVSDPLPVLRALRQQPTTVITISCVAKSHLGWELEGREPQLVRLLPGVLPAPIRHLLLTRNPLAAAVEDITDLESVGNIEFARIAPTDQRQVGQRFETDRRRLLALENMGYRDALGVLGRLRARTRWSG